MTSCCFPQEKCGRSHSGAHVWPPPYSLFHVAFVCLYWKNTKFAYLATQKRTHAWMKIVCTTIIQPISIKQLLYSILSAWSNTGFPLALFHPEWTGILFTLFYLFYIIVFYFILFYSSNLGEDWWHISSTIAQYKMIISSTGRICSVESIFIFLSLE